eukprot:3537518-Lingulodinium_polyedra.AAC.1
MHRVPAWYQEPCKHTRRHRAWHQRKTTSPALRRRVGWRRPAPPARRMGVHAEQRAAFVDAERQRLVVLRGEVAADRRA